MKIVWGLKIVWTFFLGGGGHHKIGLVLGAISMHFSIVY